MRFTNVIFLRYNTDLFSNTGIKIPHRYDRVPPVTRDRMDLQRYPPIHESYDYLNQALKENIRTIVVPDVHDITQQVNKQSLAP